MIGDIDPGLPEPIWLQLVARQWFDRSVAARREGHESAAWHQRIAEILYRKSREARAALCKADGQPRPQC